jgi:hypothetical protein
MKSGIIIFLFGVILLPHASVGQKAIKKVHFTNHTEFGGLFGRVKYNFGAGDNQVNTRLTATAQTFTGIRLNQRLSTGVTLGMDWYKTALVNPIAAGVRYDLTRGRAARLFGTLDAGYGVTWLHQDSDGYKTTGGWMINPGIGVKYGKPGATGFSISLSYKRQQLSVDKPLLWEQVSRIEDRIYNRLALRFGLVL